jgi:Concanavalin A-like lectin/glucanases superfamily
MILQPGIQVSGGVTFTGLPSIITTNLFANYDAASGISGSTFSDSSGNGRNATLFGSPTTTTINGTQVLRLTSASSQYFGYTTGYGTSLDSAFTFDVWCQNLSASTAGTLIGEWNNSTFSSGWTDAQMGFNAAQINCGVYNTAYATAQSGWNNTTWYNIVMTYNGAAGIATYVNGIAGGTQAGAKSNPGGAGTFLSMGKPDGVGTYLNGVTNYFNGYIGAWKIYNTALTANQITQNFNALRSRYGV